MTPFFRQHCTECHRADKPKAGLDLGQLKPGQDWDIWRAIVDRIHRGEMPPEDRPRPDAKQTQQAIDWIIQELTNNDQAPEVFHLLPSHGNRVPHAMLFDREPDPTAVPPARLWRISPHIYSTLVKDLTKNRVAIGQAFSSPPEPGFKDFAGLFKIDESTTSQLIRNARAIAGYQSQFETLPDGTVKGKFGARKEFIRIIDPNEELTDESIDEAIRTEFRVVLLRDPTSEEAIRFRELMPRNIDAAGRVTGLRTTLAAVMLRPELLFRSERGQGEPDELGRVMLAPEEIAFALAYTLTDKRPDRLLLEAAAKGELATREQVADQVERLWNDPKTSKPRIIRFFHEYFGYPDATDVFKEKKEFPDHHPEALVRDTDQLVEWILERDRDVLYELLTTNKSFVNFRIDRKKGPQPGHEKNKIHLSYGLPEDWKWTDQQPIGFPKKARAGILTQPSWLVAHSENLQNHPIIRGKWIRERLLGGNVPDLPITVDAQLPEDPDRTLRERMAVTRQEYCWQCHRKMNPLGLPFEEFDHFGRPRTEELGKPVDTRGSIDFTGDASLDGPVHGSVEMIHKLAKSDRVRQVFIRHVFRYFMGRNETLADARTLQEADRVYRESQGSFKSLVKSILTSDAFLMRRAVSLDE